MALSTFDKVITKLAAIGFDLNKNNMKKIMTILCLIGLISSCSKPKGYNTKIELKDSLFALQNISFANIYHSYKHIDDKLYLDSSRNIGFTQLDTFYKVKILAPLLHKDLGRAVDTNYVKRFTTSYFISKQNKVGQYQPLIIWSSGDDYTSLILAIVDSCLNPVSHLVLSGGLFGGPFETNDTLSSWGEDKFSKINNNEISTCILKTYVWTVNPDSTMIIDSLSYKSVIMDNGQIETELIDSLRIFKQKTK